jgi:hypothetical protein
VAAQQDAGPWEFQTSTVLQTQIRHWGELVGAVSQTLPLARVGVVCRAPSTNNSMIVTATKQAARAFTVADRSLGEARAWMAQLIGTDRPHESSPIPQAVITRPWAAGHRDLLSMGSPPVNQLVIGRFIPSGDVCRLVGSCSP